MKQCETVETCLNYRRNPTEEEKLGMRAISDLCMNCKIGIERERESARSRPQEKDTSCIFCWEPLPKRNHYGAKRKRKYPACRTCYSTYLASWGGKKKKPGHYGRSEAQIQKIIEDARRI